MTFLPSSESWIPLAIALGAITGALCRYYLTLFLTERKDNEFPSGTFFVNLTGAFLMGFLAALVKQFNYIPLAGEQLFLTGFLGSYTTFSSYLLDTTNLWRAKKYSTALIYWLGTPILGFILAELGLLLSFP